MKLIFTNKWFSPMWPIGKRRCGDLTRPRYYDVYMISVILLIISLSVVNNPEAIKTFTEYKIVFLIALLLSLAIINCIYIFDIVIFLKKKQSIDICTVLLMIVVNTLCFLAIFSA